MATKILKDVLVGLADSDRGDKHIKVEREYENVVMAEDLLVSLRVLAYKIEKGL